LHARRDARQTRACKDAGQTRACKHAPYGLLLRVRRDLPLKELAATNESLTNGRRISASETLRSEIAGCSAAGARTGLGIRLRSTLKATRRKLRDAPYSAAEMHG
jgi:hypothetical protein